MQSTAIPQILYDLYTDFGNDLSVTGNGDIATVTGAIRSQQRVLRRLLTAINGYIWVSGYGAGVPSFVGLPLSGGNYDQLQSLILSNIFLESSVSQTPNPVIFIQSIPNGIFVQINYTENPTQNPIVLTFNVSN